MQEFLQKIADNWEAIITFIKKIWEWATQEGGILAPDMPWEKKPTEAETEGE